MPEQYIMRKLRSQLFREARRNKHSLKLTERDCNATSCMAIIERSMWTCEYCGASATLAVQYEVETSRSIDQRLFSQCTGANNATIKEKQ